MKSHNSKLCSGPCSHSRVARRGTSLQALRRAASAQPCNRACDHHAPLTESADELTCLILQLEDEFAQLNMYVPITVCVFEAVASALDNYRTNSNTIRTLI